MRSRAAFTLVEVLIVLGVVALLATLVLPAGLARTDRTRSAVAESLLLLAPSSAAAEARLSRTPLALVLDSDSDGRLRLMTVRPPVDDDGGAMGGADAFGGRGLDGPGGMDGLDGEDPSAWPRVGIVRALPAGVELIDSALLETRLPLGTPAGGLGQGGDGAGEAGRGLPPIEGLAGLDLGVGADGDGPEPVGTVLAWFLTDGVALEPRPVVLRLPDGRVVRLAIEPLTGRASLGEVNDATADAGADAGADADDRGDAGGEDAGDDLDTGFRRPDRSQDGGMSGGGGIGDTERDGVGDGGDRPATESGAVPRSSPGRPAVRRGGS